MRESDRRLIETFKLDHFFEMSPAFMCIAGYEGYFLKVNPAVIQTLGYSEYELLNLPINTFIHPDDRETTSHYREQVRNGVPLINFENRYITKSGDVIWLQWTTISDTQNKLIYGIAKNVTARKRLEAERNSVLEDLARINTELKVRTLTTSHDLRSPLGNLLTIFDLLDTSTISDPQTLMFLDMLKTTTHTIKNTVDNYLNPDLYETKFESDTEDIYLPKVLDGVVDLLKASLNHKHAIIKTDFTESHTIRFKSDYLESILLNLISNSIKYSKPDQVLELSISIRKLDTTTQLIYQDNGIGFDLNAVKDKVFGYQQSFSNHADSKGIGLFLIQTYMTRLGGGVSLESAPEQGARFILSFKN